MLRFILICFVVIAATACDQQPATSASNTSAATAPPATEQQVAPPAAEPQAAAAQPLVVQSIAGPASGNTCGKDTDCKGERICEAGVCVNPSTVPAAVEAASQANAVVENSPAASATTAPSSNHAALAEVDSLQQALIAAMSLDALTQTRLGDSGAAIRAYAKAGLVDLKPNIRLDYSDYRRLKRPAPFLGHELLLIEEEYMTAYIGCCVSPGVAVLLKLYPDGVNLGEFIQGRGCSLNADVTRYADIAELQLPPLRYGSVIEISCKERDAVSTEPQG